MDQCLKCPECIVDPDTGAPVCTKNGVFVYDGMCEKERKCKHHCDYGDGEKKDSIR